MSFNLTLIAQAVAFALFIWFTIKFVWPPLLRAIEARQKQVADGLAAAEQAIQEARTRAAEIIAQAEKRGGQVVDEAKSVAKAEGDREKAAAKADIQQEAQRAREMLREQVAALAVAGAEKILRREIDAKAHAELLDGIKKQL